MSIETKQLGLISRIYDGVICHSLWPDLLQDCAEDVGAVSCILASANTINPQDFNITAYSNHFTADIIEDYETNLAHYDRTAWSRLQHMPFGTMMDDGTRASFSPRAPHQPPRHFLDCRAFSRQTGIVFHPVTFAPEYSYTSKDMVAGSPKRGMREWTPLKKIDAVRMPCRYEAS